MATGNLKRRTRAGTPPTMANGGTSWLTTAPCAYDRARRDLHAVQDDGAGTDPDIVADLGAAFISARRGPVDLGHGGGEEGGVVPHAGDHALRAWRRAGG